MIVLNDKNPKLNEILNKIKENNGYCPCAPIKDSDTKCPCKQFRDIKQGICQCGAFIKI